MAIKDLFGNKISENKSGDDYQKHIASAKWRRTRNAKIKQAGERCEMCGISKWSAKLEVHHLTYDRLGNERMDDLRVLCPDCHSGADEERKVKSKERKAIEFANSSLARGFENWMDRGKNVGWRRLSDQSLSLYWRDFLNQLGRKTGRQYDTPFRRSIEWNE